MMDHFPQMRILDHEQRHCHCNRIRLFIFQSFILCIHLFLMTGFRWMFSFLLIFNELVYVCGADFFWFTGRHPFQLPTPAVYGTVGDFQFLGCLGYPDLFHEFYGIASELFCILAHKLPFTMATRRSRLQMLIAGPSKAGKSFLLIELAIAIAEGSEWLGFSCVQGKVLYVNLEIDPASCIDRFVTIYGRLGFTPPHTENIVIWNLRGHALPLDKLVPILVRRMKDEQFAAVIIDPIYKVITGDENNASDMGAFCNQFDKICTEMGASAIYCHHHSKGAQGGKKAMDRASGSGVFARDPDAQLDIIELKKPLFKETEAETEDGEVIEIEQFDTTRSAWRLEASLREFPPITPVNFYFDYPLHPVDTEGVLATYQPEGSSIGNLGLSSRKSTPEKRKLRLDEAYEAAAAEGMVTVKSMAEIAELSVETIRRYLKEFRDDYIVKNGVVQERPPMDNSTAQNMTV